MPLLQTNFLLKIRKEKTGDLKIGLNDSEQRLAHTELLNHFFESLIQSKEIG